MASAFGPLGFDQRLMGQAGHDHMVFDVGCN
jgi:hypothetical protein